MSGVRVSQVYIGGGGELATAREVLRHKSVETCVMVDLDKVRWQGGCLKRHPQVAVHGRYTSCILTHVERGLCRLDLTTATNPDDDQEHEVDPGDDG